MKFVHYKCKGFSEYFPVAQGNIRLAVYTLRLESIPPTVSP